MLELTTGVVFLMSSVYGSGQSDNHIQSINASRAATETATTSEVRSFTTSSDIQSYLHEQYFDTPILIEIARCESEFRQFDKNGNIVRGRVNADDVGVMQINEFYHADTARKMGLNLKTAEGNVAFGKYLYAKYGTSPWSASEPCWSKAKVADLARK
jgi:soluble lytic murein transglycosylase-like protein